MNRHVARPPHTTAELDELDVLFTSGKIGPREFDERRRAILDALGPWNEIVYAKGPPQIAPEPPLRSMVRWIANKLRR